MKHIFDIPIILCLLIAAMLFGSCSETDEYIPDEFEAAVMATSPTVIVDYILLESLSELMDTVKPNLIVRCKVASRGESYLKGANESLNSLLNQSAAALTDTELKRVQSAVANSLSTPYTLELEKIYLGAENLDDTTELVFTVPYGAINGYARAADKYPILKVGAEYLMFLRVDFIGGEKEYYLAFRPASALELRNDSFDGGDYADLIFAEFNGSTEALISELEELIANNDYDISIEGTEA
ncbi:MAG TPA: hypothetical protein H9681_02705 [Firmicutes bacterium]|nr:hypothetical protein [Bacillota bacterium]